MSDVRYDGADHPFGCKCDKHYQPASRTLEGETPDREREKAIIDEWAQNMADLCEGPDAGWAIYADWLRAFLSATRPRHHASRSSSRPPEET